MRFLEKIEGIFEYIFISLLFSIILALSDADQRSFIKTITDIFIAVPVGTLGGMLAIENDFGKSASLAVSAVCALLAKNIISAIINHKDYVDRVIKNLIDRSTGGRRE